MSDPPHTTTSVPQEVCADELPILSVDVGVELATSAPSEIPTSTNHAFDSTQVEDKPVGDNSVEHTSTQLEDKSNIAESTSPKTTTAISAAVPGVPLKRGEEGFTSEIYKIRVDHLPKYASVADFKKKLKQLTLKPIKVSVVPKRPPFGFVTFESEEEKQAALKIIHGVEWKHGKLKATGVDPKPGTDLGNRTNKRSGDREGGDNKRQKSNLLPDWEQINDKTVKYWRIKYEDQLVSKNETVRSVMQDFKKELSYLDLEWVRSQKKEDLICPVEPIIPSKVVDGYRNKCEFTVGPGESPIVGFLNGSYSEGMRVVRPTKCPHVSETMKAVASHFEVFAKDSGLPGFDREAKTGYWRLLVVRENSQGEIMIVGQLHNQDLSKEEVAVQASALSKHFVENFSDGPTVNSVFIQVHRDLSHNFPSKDIELVHGSPVLKETLLGLEFDISPTSFFQVNHGGAESLYSLIREWSSIDPSIQDNSETIVATGKPNVLDICCGTGTIGLIMSSTAAKVFGVDIVESAIQDAQKNAERNSISNAEFVCGKAEIALPALVKKALLESQSLVGIADPPRCGLHNDVVKVVRATSQIKRLVYVACDARQSVKTFVSLCRPTSNNYTGTPFRPSKVTSVDMFPHTPGFEFVMLLERD
eukprot:CFRG1133T1